VYKESDKEAKACARTSALYVYVLRTVMKLVMRGTDSTGPEKYSITHDFFDCYTMRFCILIQMRATKLLSNIKNLSY